MKEGLTPGFRAKTLLLEPSGLLRGEVGRVVLRRGCEGVDSRKEVPRIEAICLLI